jgi:hypothetical protein
MTMKCVIKKPGSPAEVADIDGGYKSMQSVVGGLFTLANVPGISDKGNDVWANDEGFLLGLPFNIRTRFQPLVGNLLVIGHNDEGENVGLTDDEANNAVKILNDLSY